ncbi:MAG: outer membrane lipid asymmetry maintenance protein MlaD [Myxococcota bacterium]|nr:outer membrane lipid asymmetry maintenance protein MlaD [Myxococcota bacterium]
MRSSPARDLAVGLFVLAGLVALAVLSVQVGGLAYTGGGGLRLSASFDEIGSLSERAPVVISGVKVGQVTSVTLGEDLRAEVTLDVDRDLELPVDTFASIRTAGLLGDQFIALEPGGDDELLADGGYLSFTKSALNIERLVDRIVTSFQSGDGAE